MNFKTHGHATHKSLVRVGLETNKTFS